MATNNSSNQKFTNNSDGFDLAGGTTPRKLTVSGGDIAAVGSGAAVISFPTTTSTLATLALSETLTNKTLTTPVINGLPTGTGVASAATVSTLVSRDASANSFASNFVDGFTTTATATGTTTLTVASTRIQVFTGTLAQTVVLPVTSTLGTGFQFYIVNLSTLAVTVQSSGANNIVILPGGTTALLTCQLASGTTAASWVADGYQIGVTTGKKLSVTNTLTLSGTDATTMTFPSTSATIARTDAAQTFTGTQTFSQVVTTNNAIAAVANAATVPITSRISTVTNSSAATLTITMTTTSAVDGMLVMVRILDFSAVAQTITWVNTENSSAPVPTTSNGSTTLPLTVGLQYNNATSKWRCISVA